MNKFGWLILVLFLCLFWACEEGEPIDYSDAEAGREYFPFEKGQSRTYRIDSFLYDLKGGEEVVIDTSRSYLRYSVSEIIDDSDDSPKEVDVLREYRTSDTAQWRFHDRIEYRMDASELICKEGNINLKLAAFPITADRRWNPTLYTDPGLEIFVLGEPIEALNHWEGSVRQFDSTGAVLDLSDVSLLKTSLADFTSLIEHRQVEEIYAKTIGLVSRELSILDTQCEQLGGDPAACADMPWEDIANRGFIVQQQLIDYE